MSAHERAAIRVRVTVSDPWEFTSDDGSNVSPVVTANAIATRDREDDFPLLLDSGTAVVTNQGSARFFVARTTEKRTGAFAELLRSEPIDCSIIGISDDAAMAEPIEAARATVRLA